MPWKETSPMQVRLTFVVEWLKHETSMAELCRRYGISRQTGYEVIARYRAHGLDGLKPQSRAPHHHPNAIDEAVCAAVIRAKARHPTGPANWHWHSGRGLGSVVAAQAKPAGSQIRRTEPGDRHARVNGSDKSPGSTESAI